jgi:hypothetical protein
MTRQEGQPLEPAIATEVVGLVQVITDIYRDLPPRNLDSVITYFVGALRDRAEKPLIDDASGKILCTDPECVAAFQCLSCHDLEVIDGVLDQLDKLMHSALHYEARYSKKHGYEKGHYWLHRKIDQIIGLAIQHVEDHLEGTPHT